MRCDYRIQMDHALLLGKILLEGRPHRGVYAERGRRPYCTRCFMNSAASPQKALEKAFDMVSKPDPSVLFFPQAQRALTVLDSTIS